MTMLENCAESGNITIGDWDDDTMETDAPEESSDGVLDASRPMLDEFEALEISAERARVSVHQFF
jgi:hypothetical protein